MTAPKRLKFAGTKDSWRNLVKIPKLRSGTSQVVVAENKEHKLPNEPGRYKHSIATSRHH